jgi:sulfur carrier protein
VKIWLNGEEEAARNGATVAELLAAQGVAPETRGVAVALDGEVVRRGEWATTVVGNGQRLELLTAAQGG